MISEHPLSNEREKGNHHHFTRSCMRINHAYLSPHVVEIGLQMIDFRGERRRVVHRPRLHYLSAHFNDVLHFGLDIGQRVVDAAGVMNLQKNDFC